MILVLSILIKETEKYEYRNITKMGEELLPLLMVTIRSTAWRSEWGNVSMFTRVFLNRGIVYRIRDTHPLAQSLRARQFVLHEPVVVTNDDLLVIGKLSELIGQDIHFQDIRGKSLDVETLAQGVTELQLI